MFFLFTNLFRHGEMINHTENIYTLKDNIQIGIHRDISGGRLCLVYYCLYIWQKIYKKELLKVFKYNLISLILMYQQEALAIF